MMNNATFRSSLSSALLSLKSWAIGVSAGVLTLALGSGATNNHSFMQNLHDEWILWTAASVVTMITGGGARFVQHANAIDNGTVGAAIMDKAAAIVQDPTKSIPVAPAPPAGGTS